jgi:predicted transcriptional regulator of viral defense system
MLGRAILGAPSVWTSMDERAIAKLAARQRGVVTAEQLRRAGFDRHAVKRRCRAGRLHRLHRGVYLVGHAVAPEFAAEMAAVLACGPESVVSHRSAARLWLLPVPPARTSAVDISVAGRDPRCRAGITLHRVRALEASDIRRVHGVPVTAPARTLLDLATALPFDDLEVAFIDARSRRLLGGRDLAATLARSAKSERADRCAGSGLPVADSARRRRGRRLRLPRRAPGIRARPGTRCHPCSARLRGAAGHLAATGRATRGRRRPDCGRAGPSWLTTRGADTARP